jgi:hypothetical protein
VVDTESKENTETRSLGRWIRANKWLIIFVVGLFWFIISWIIWVGDDDLDKDAVNSDLSATTPIVPETTTEPIVRSDWNNDNFTLNVNLRYQYPTDWTKTTDVTDQLNEFVYLRSPNDINGFYYCIDLLEYNAASTIDLNMAAKVVDSDPTFTADGIFKGLNRITYQSLDLSSGFHTTIIDDMTITTGDSVVFTESITNPDGRMLQLLGRYNCDESQIGDFTLDQYQNGRLYLQGLQIFHSIHY